MDFPKIRELRGSEFLTVALAPIHSCLPSQFDPRITQIRRILDFTLSVSIRVIRGFRKTSVWSIPMSPLDLPANVIAVFQAFRTCEFTTLAKDGRPITWPTLPFFDAEQGRFVITTSIALAQKAANIRANPPVPLLFSDPAAGGLPGPAAVLIQGDAVAPDEIVTSIQGSEDQLQMVFERQPSSAIYSSNPLMRYLF